MITNVLGPVVEQYGDQLQIVKIDVTQQQGQALFLAAMQTGRLDLLGEGTKDRLHQPYRAPLVPGMPEVLSEGERAGALACFLSGAGPTLLALVAGDPGDVGARMARCWEAQTGVVARVLVLPIDRQGIRVEEE